MSLPTRLRWVTVFAAVALAAGAVVASAHGTDELGACSRVPQHLAPASGTAWRNDMLRAAGCRAWHRLHIDLSSVKTKG